MFSCCSVSLLVGKDDKPPGTSNESASNLCSSLARMWAYKRIHVLQFIFTRLHRTWKWLWLIFMIQSFVSFNLETFIKSEENYILLNHLLKKFNVIEIIYKRYFFIGRLKFCFLKSIWESHILTTARHTVFRQCNHILRASDTLATVVD